MKRYSKLITAALLAGLMAAGTGCKDQGIGVVGTDSTAASSNEPTSETTEEFSETSKETEKKTKTIESYIEKYFYFDIDSEKREESYYDGIMEGLDDPYSVYYTKEEFSALMEEDSGEYVGIGATVSKNVDTNLIYVVKPLRGSPAEAAGVLPGDVFVKVDDTDITTGMSLDEVVKLIRGEAGTTAHIKFYREGESDYINIDIDRQAVQNITVSYEMLQDNIGYISVEQFIDNTPEQFQEGVDAMISQGAKALIIDVRNNPGGMLSSVIDMVDYLIADDKQADGADDKGILLQTKDKTGAVIEQFTCEDGHSVELPMAVLINGNSASASEILTGCLKDYNLATIVGENTYGKGIVQQIIPLYDGSAIKITIAKYFTPSGNDIHKVGIAPQVEIVLPDSMKRTVTIPHEKDNQLQKAIEILGGTPLEEAFEYAEEEMKDKKEPDEDKKASDRISEAGTEKTTESAEVPEEETAEEETTGAE